MTQTEPSTPVGESPQPATVAGVSRPKRRRILGAAAGFRGIKIRWKLLFLLLLIALLPVVMVSYSGHSTTRKLGYQLSEQVRQTLTDGAKRELNQIVAGYADLLDRDRQLLEFMLRMQAQAVEQRLQAERPPRDPPRAYFAEDFYVPDLNNPGAPLPELVRPPRYAVMDEHHEPGEAVPVSFEHHVNWLPEGVEPADVADQVTRLADLSDVYRRLREEHPELVLWQYTSLTSGLHLSYPGKSAYPEDYDPRQRPWFGGTREMDSLIWWPPNVDVSTRQVILTLAMPVRDRGGNFAGVTCIDVPLGNILVEDRLPQRWAEHAQVMLVWTVPDLAESQNPILQSAESLPEEPRPLIMAQKAYHAARGLDWRVPVSLELLNSDDTAGTKQMVQAMLEGESEVRQMPFRGEPAMWAHGPVDDQGAHLVIIVPNQVIVAGAERAEREVIAETWQRLQNSGLVLALVIAGIVLVAWRGSHVVTDPVETLATTAKQLAAGDLSARAEVNRRDELGQLAAAFNQMIPKLQERFRMRQSLSLAMEVQQSLLPNAPPQLPHLDIAAHSVYCDETGGDYYDFLEFDDLDRQRVGIAVGDVTGHGIAAALLMATCRALLRSRVSMSGSLADVIGDMNRHLSADELDGRFMTLFYLVLEDNPPRARWVSAGHDPALVYSPANDDFFEVGGNDIPLGVVNEWTFHEYEHEGFQPGQIIVLGTDGIWECPNGKQEQFGKDRLRDVIRQYRDQPAIAICNAVSEALQAYRGPTPQEDDVTLVVVKVREANAAVPVATG